MSAARGTKSSFGPFELLPSRTSVQRIPGPWASRPRTVRAVARPRRLAGVSGLTRSRSLALIEPETRVTHGRLRAHGTLAPAARPPRFQPGQVGLSSEAETPPLTFSDARGIHSTARKRSNLKAGLEVRRLGRFRSVLRVHASCVCSLSAETAIGLMSRSGRVQYARRREGDPGPDLGARQAPARQQEPRQRGPARVPVVP